MHFLNKKTFSKLFLNFFLRKRQLHNEKRLKKYPKKNNYLAKITAVTPKITPKPTPPTPHPTDFINVFRFCSFSCLFNSFRLSIATSFAKVSRLIVSSFKAITVSSEAIYLREAKTTLSATLMTLFQWFSSALFLSFNSICLIKSKRLTKMLSDLICPYTCEAVITNIKVTVNNFRFNFAKAVIAVLF